MDASTNCKKNVKKLADNIHETLFALPSSVTSYQDDAGPSTSSNSLNTNSQLRFFYKPEMIKWENKFFEIDEKEKEEEEAILSQFLNEQQQNSKQNNYFECQTKFVNLPVHGCKMALPEGSTSKSSTLCEEIHIPPPIDNNKKFLANFPRLKIDELDEFAQTAFDGIKSLNVIQSQVFDQAYNTLNNLLICAPTGAGKTNIALLTILRTIRDNRTKNGKINKNAFKVIYLAPMKALATEMTSNFSKRLGRLGLKTRELTGDSQLSRKEIQETQVLVLTPEKWDVITRKSDDEELSQLVRLLIIDEVHLLHDDRGPVIEAIIARTLRRIEVYHQNIRIVGLSATLPNYNDVATFLRVDPTQGLFHFDGRFRPVPLAQTFLGVRDSERQAIVLQREREKAIRKGEKPPTKISQNKLMTQKEMMDEVCYQKCVKFLYDKHQVLIFVHSRNATGQLARTFIDKAANSNQRELFLVEKGGEMNNAQSRELQFLFQSGLGIHHAGLTRHDRHLMEKMFTEGAIRVMMCTATLAWGVNLPAYAVIIRGTEIFDPQKGIFTDIGILDVQQIFGRAGRPQYEDMGHGVIITNVQKLAHYIEMFHRQTPIESQFQSRILNNLNAEIASGAISNISEAIEWIHFTYFYIRLRKNPLQYGVDWKELRKDSQLNAYLSDFCHSAARRLDANRMIRYDPINNFVSATDLGRIASNYYIGFETIELINDHNGPISLTEMMTDEMIIALISSCSEFAQIKNRDSEMTELDELASFGANLKIRSGLATTAGKVNCLLQSYISRAFVKDFALSSELYYISQNAGRIARAIFEIALRRGWAQTTEACLTMAKCIEQRLWPFNSPLRHLADVDLLSFNVVQKIESRRMNLFSLYDMDAKDLGYLCSSDGKVIYEAIRMLPFIDVEANIRPITCTIIQIEALLYPSFTWCDRLGGAQRFWVIVEDADANIILHHEIFILLKKMALSGDPQRLIFTIPVNEDQVKHQYLLRVASDRYIVEDTVVPLTLATTVMPTSIKPHTDLLDLEPLPLSALKNVEYQQLYSFQFFNPVQTQVFHTLYATDENSLIGAPTSSGKTLCAELAIFRLFNLRPLKKCVYIAPLKALVRERVLDWEQKFNKKLGFPIVEVSGDNTPDVEELNLASILVTTPEKWDGITRIKTLARRRELAKLPIRIIGLSTALANAGDVANWIGVPDSALFNFRPSVRPVPIQVHIQGFPGQHYCPRMGLMNKPAFQYIKQFSPSKPVLIFVASRRQTRLTSMALLSLLQREPDSKQQQWLKMEQLELEALLKDVRDDNLALTLNYGIGMHHAGLQHSERALVERLFVERKIQILVATATLAWGINVPAHLVIVKGTEYYDGKTHKYIDFPVTDVLQMIGRAGRPQYDTSAVAVVFVQDVKKNFYKRFLYEPFPVESNLLPVLPNHVNAEICSGSIVNRQQIVEYLAGTYLYRRLFANPAYYGIEQLNNKELTTFLSTTVDSCLVELCASYCILPDLENDGYIHSTPFGRIASRYYLEHRTIRHFKDRICQGMSVEQLLLCLTECPEYEEIPVRHNEDQINREIQVFLPIKLEVSNWESSHVKTHLLYQAHFSRMHLPVDYITDQRSIIESCIRILQAMFDFCIEMHLLNTTLNVLILQQQIFQARWYTDHPLLCLPHLSAHSIDGIGPLCSIPQIKERLGIYQLNNGQKLNKKEEKRIITELCSKSILSEKEADELLKALLQWPILSLEQIYLLPQQKKQRQKFEEKLIINVGMNGKNLEFSASTNYKIFVSLRLCGPYLSNSNAFCPKFPKKRMAGWILLLGDATTNRLWGHERIPSLIEEQKIARLRILTPNEPGIYQLLLLVISDTYLGIDQQYMLNFKVV